MELISYAQNFEDIRLWRAFKDVENGRYLDIGTQDPNHDSVSRLFYDLGWRGVHVEPTPHYASAMRGARPDEQVIEAAVSSSPVPLAFFEIPNTGLSTGVPAIAKFHQDAGWTFQKILVPTISLASLLDYMGQDPIHWLKIDVEGMEADVIASWGDHPARPAALVIEATKPSTQQPTHEAWHAMVTARGYSEVLFDGLSRYFIHETESHRGEALALSPNVFDGFQVMSSHFLAGRLAGETAQEIAVVRSEAEAQAQAHAEHLAEAASTAAEASAQLEAALQRVGDLESRLAGETEALASALSEAQAGAVETAAQIEVALQRAEELECRLVQEADAHAQAHAQAYAAAVELEAAQQVASELEVRLAAEAEAYAQDTTQAHAAAAEAAAQLDAAVKRIAALEGQLASEAAVHAADLAQAQAAAAIASATLDEALREAAALDQQRTGENAANAAALAKASAAALEISAKLDIANTRATGLELRLREQAQLHATALAMADERSLAAQRALDDMNGQLALVQAEYLALGRLAGRLEGQLEAQERSNGASMAAAAAQRGEMRDLFQSAERELATLRDLAADLRTRLAVQIALGEAAAAAAAAEKAAADALISSVREKMRQLSGQVVDLTASLAAVTEQRDEFGTQVQGLTFDRVSLAEELETTRREAAEVRRTLLGQIENLHADLGLRERKIADAQNLLVGMPDPLGGISGLRQALARLLIGAGRLSAMADHHAATFEWQHDNLQPVFTTSSGDDNTPLDCARHDPHAHSATVGASMLIDEGTITSVAQLLAPHDRLFIQAAYCSVLGRRPEPEGEAYYLGRLRGGAHKLAILKQLRRSPEGRTFVPAVAGLDRAIKRHIWATRPLIGPIVRFFTGAEGNSAKNVQFRIMANDIRCVLAEQAELRAGQIGVRSEIAALRSEFGELAGFMQQLAARPIVISEQSPPRTAPLPKTPPEPQPEPQPQPPSLGLGPVPLNLDSTERRILKGLRLSALTRGVAA